MRLIVFIRIFLIRGYSLLCFRKKSKVIFYHDIHSDNQYTNMSTSLSLFHKHISIIKESGYQIVPEITKEYGEVEICFDDAFLGLYENIEFIRKHNVFIHLFVISSFLEREGYLNAKQLLELNRSHLIKVSSHTHTHRILNHIDMLGVEKELKESKVALENLLNITVDSICYPQGRFNKQIIHIAERIGYKKQYSSLPGFFSDRFQHKVIRRSLVQFAQEQEFKAILKGGDHILGLWYKFKHVKR